jgi:hypothetical protein
MTLQRAVSVSQLMKTTLKGLPFEGDWLASFGKPEITGSWLIWGNSGNGKTRFALQLAKYLTSFCKNVAYDSLEEGVSLSFRNAVSDCGMQECSRRFILLDKEPVPDLIERLEKHKSPDIIIIDTLQYTGLNYADYKILRDRFRNKLFILLSHADGRHPAGRVARSIRYDAFVKIWVEGYRAFPVSRYGGGEPYTIWEEGAENYIHSNNNQQ